MITEPFSKSLKLISVVAGSGKGFTLLVFAVFTSNFFIEVLIGLCLNDEPLEFDGRMELGNCY